MWEGKLCTFAPNLHVAQTHGLRYCNHLRGHQGYAAAVVVVSEVDGVLLRPLQPCLVLHERYAVFDSATKVILLSCTDRNTHNSVLGSPLWK